MKSGKKEIRNSNEQFLNHAILKFGHEKFVKKTRTLYMKNEDTENAGIEPHVLICARFRPALIVVLCRHFDGRGLKYDDDFNVSDSRS